MRSLRSSASRIIAASKPTPAMTAKRSPAKRPTSSAPARAASPIAHRAARCPSGCPRFVAKRFAVPAGMTARRGVAAGELADAAAHRAVAAPREDESAPSSRARRDLPGAFLALGTSYHSGSGCPRSARTRRSSGQAAAERLLGVGDDRDLHEAACTAAARRDASARAGAALAGRASARARRAAREQQHHHRADADEDAAGDVERVVHAAVHPRQSRRTTGSDDRQRPGDDAHARGCRTPEVEQEHEAGVDGDRRGGVAGRVARVRPGRSSRRARPGAGAGARAT